MDGASPRVEETVPCYCTCTVSLAIKAFSPAVAIHGSGLTGFSRISDTVFKNRAPETNSQIRTMPERLSRGGRRESPRRHNMDLYQRTFWQV